MGKHLSGLPVDLETKDHSGCGWGIIIHFVNYHHRYKSNRVILFRKRRRLRLFRCFINTKTISMPHDSGKAQVLQKDEAKHVKQHMTARSAELFKKEKDMDRKLGLYAQPQLQKTNSFPHLDPSSNVPSRSQPVSLVHKKSGSSGSKFMDSKPTNMLERPVSGLRELDSQRSLTADNNQSSERPNILREKFGRMSEISRNDTAITKKLRRAISDRSAQKSLDVMEMFKVNKELFHDIMQDPALGIRKHFPEKHCSTTNEKFTRSGSFPLPNSFDRRYLRPATLEHKQHEIWSFARGEKSLDFLSLKPMTLRTNGSVGRAKSEETEPSSLESHHLAWSALLLNLFKDVMHIFKHAKKDKKQRSKHTKSGDPPVEVSSVQRAAEKNMGQVSMSSHSKCHHSDAPDPGHENRELHRVRRTTSLNESLDRYAKLFEGSFSGDSKLSHSKSLRMSGEDKLSSRKYAPKFFRRISSLSELDSLVSILRVVSRGDPSSELPVGVVEESATFTTNGDEKNEQKSINISLDNRKNEPTEAVLNTELEGAIAEANNQSSVGLLVDTIVEGIHKPVDFDKDLAEPGSWERKHPHEHVNLLETSRELMEQISSTEQHEILEGSNSNPLKLESDSLPDFSSTADGEKVENKRTQINQDFAGPESDRDPNAGFNYVRDVLQLSGFVGNEDFVTWHSPSQPLSPSLSQELETWSPDEKCDNQRLFDLVNESLLDIYDQSPGYFPRGFYFSSGTCQMPKSMKLVEQVWRNVRKKLDCIPKQGQSLDDIVGRDLVKDSWMNLQFDAESVALDLEDLIFDELLDQALFL